MMRYARACPDLVGRSLKTIFGRRVQARRYDCSSILTIPVQTSVGKLQSGRLAP
ncbi:MAG: hypothetical protein QOE55_657, partial [Acidobacteriaceae bacterium]|nr:hypothetical protein [Acidobacteriaceae bacterium]